MWTCPKCGRTFKKQNQGHYCGKAPEAEERISWSMPTFWKGNNIIQFAGFKNHIGLYPGPEAVMEFSGRLKGYKTSKGTVQLPYSKPLPLELIKDIVSCWTLKP